MMKFSDDDFRLYVSCIERLFGGLSLGRCYPNLPHTCLAQEAHRVS